MQVYLNGDYLDHSEATVSVDDRGFIFGDGVYEVFRGINGRLYQAGPHMQRLDYGLQELQIDLQREEQQKLPEVAGKLLEKNGLTEGQATVYLQVTRGAAPRGHGFPDPPVPPTVFMAAKSFTPNEELQQNGASAITTSDIRWTRCDIKSVNLLPNVLAKQKASEAGVFSTVMIRGGVVTEGQNANVFGVKDGTVYTYPATNYILNGITRRVAIELLGELEVPVREEPITEASLADLDELFLTGTTTDIQPVTRLDGRPVGSGAPGPVTMKLWEALRRDMHEIAGVS